MRISDWSSDVCSSDLVAALLSSDRAQSPPDRHAAHLFRHASHGGGQLSKPALQGRLSSHRLCHIWFAHPHQQRSGGLGKGYPRLYRRERQVSVQPLLERQRIDPRRHRSEEHTSELQSLMSISYAVFCLKKKTKNNNED